MVDLPGVPRRFVTSQAPQTMVTGREVAAAGQAMPRALETAAQGIDEGMKPWAEQAGRMAVERTPDGQVKVSQPFPIFGRLGDIYTASAQKAYQAEFNSTMQTGLQDLAQKTMLPVEQGGGGGDPEWFRKQSQAFISQRAANQRGGFQDHARVEGDVMADQYYRGVQNTKFQKDTAAQRDTINARMDSLATDLANMAFQGGTGTPEFQKAWAERQALRQTMAGDPRFNYTPAEAERDARRDMSMMTAEAITGTARRSYEKDGNLARAQQDAEKALEDLPGLKPEEKIAWLGNINKHLASANAARTEYVNELKTKAKSIGAVMDVRGKWDDTEVDKTLAELRANRQWAAAGELEGKRIIANGMPTVKTGSASEAAATMRSVTGETPSPPGSIGGVIEAAAARHGVDPNVLKRVAQIESRFDPNAVNKAVPYDKAAKGMFQFIPSTWKQYGGGANIFDPNAQADAAARLLKANQQQLYQALGREPTGAELYLAHQQGAAGAAALLRNPGAPAASIVGMDAVTLNGGSPGMTAGQFAQLWKNKYDQTGVSNRVNDAAIAWRSDPARAPVILAFQTAYNDRTREAWTEMTGMWDKGQKPNDQQLTDLATLLPQVSDDKLRKEIRDRLAQEAGKGALAASGATLQQLGDVFRQFDDAAKEGLASPADAKFAFEVKKMVDQREKLVKDYPVDYGRSYLDKRDVGDVPPIFYGAPDTFAASMSVRSRALGLVKQIEPQAGDNPFLPGEQSTIAKMLPNMPAEAAQGMIQAMVQQFTPAQLRAALQDPELHQAVIGLTKTMDPARMKVGFDLMDKLDRDNPLQFKADFPGMDKQLDVWKAKTSYLPADQVVKDMQQISSPSYKAAREEAEKAGQKLVEKMTPGDVANQFNKGLSFYTPGVGVMPPVSTQTPIIQGQMATEWKDLFSTYYAELGDEGQAKELATKRLGQKWGPTSVGSMGAFQQRLMPYPPEKMYPAIDGSHAWVNEQLNQDIIASVGDAGGTVGEGVRTKAFGGPMTPEQQTAWDKAAAPRAIVADSTTEADIAAGRPPSYSVVLYLNSRYQVLDDGKGNTMRFRPDPKAGPGAKADAAFKDVRDGMREVQRQNEALFGSRDGPGGADTRKPEDMAPQEWLRATPANPLKGFVPQKGK